jgi:hypothetical protein
MIRTSIAIDQADLARVRRAAYEDGVGVTVWMRDVVLGELERRKAEKRRKVRRKSGAEAGSESRANGQEKARDDRRRSTRPSERRT